VKKSECPSCKATIELPDDVKPLDLVTCQKCNAFLELVWLFPPTLDWAEDPPVIASHRFYTHMR
jgi:lysine biosynthesis protein LysW